MLSTYVAIDGSWSDYGAWSECSATCGDNGNQVAYRSCTNPRPQNGGAECEGEDSRSRSCNEVQPCRE